MQFKVSVIIPVYNAEKYVRKAVESALQEEEVAEVILIEDASPDNALAVCEQLANEYERVGLFQHPDKANHGAGASRNLGIEKASFAFIAFLDADDYFLPLRFKRDKEVLTSRLDVDGVYNALGFDYLDEVGKSKISGRVGELTTVIQPIAPEDLFEQMSPIGNKGYFSCDALTVRREVFNKVGNFDTQLAISQDTHMWIRMAAKCKLVAGVIDRPVAMRGVHAHNRSDNFERKRAFRPYLFRSLLDWGIVNRLPINRLALLWEQYYLWEVLSRQELTKTSRSFFKIAFIVYSIGRYPFLLRSLYFYKKFF